MNPNPRVASREPLTISRESLKRLSETELTAAVGGAVWFTTKCTQAHGGGESTHDCAWNWSTFITDIF